MCRSCHLQVQTASYKLPEDATKNQGEISCILPFLLLPTSLPHSLLSFKEANKIIVIYLLSSLPEDHALIFPNCPHRCHLLLWDIFEQRAQIFSFLSLLYYPPPGRNNTSIVYANSQYMIKAITTNKHEIEMLIRASEKIASSCFSDQFSPCQWLVFILFILLT